MENQLSILGHLDYMLELLRNGEKTQDQFRDELRSAGFGDPEITEILAEEGIP